MVTMDIGLNKKAELKGHHDKFVMCWGDSYLNCVHIVPTLVWRYISSENVFINIFWGQGY